MTLEERKAALREEVRRRTRGTKQASRAAQERLLASGLLTGTVGLYRALPVECGTELLAGALGERACFPCVNPGGAELEFRRAGGSWTRGSLGVLEPAGEVVPLDEIGTDPNRYYGVSPALGAHYNTTWFARENLGWLADDYKARFTAGY